MNLDGVNDHASRPKREAGPDSNLIDPTETQAQQTYDPLTGQLRSTSPTTFFDAEKCKAAKYNCDQASDDAKTTLAKGDDKASAGEKDNAIDKCYANCSAMKMRTCSDSAERDRYKIKYFSCNKAEESRARGAEEIIDKNAAQDEAAERTLAADKDNKVDWNDSNLVSSNFSYTDPAKGDSKCYAYYGRSTEVTCVALQTGQTYQTHALAMGAQASYIPEMRRPTNIPLASASIPPSSSAGILPFTSGPIGDENKIAPGRADRDRQDSAGTDAAPTPANPTPAPVERPAPVAAPAPTPQPQVQAQNTQVLNGGNMGSLNGSTLNSGNPFSPSPMNWASTNVASNSSSDYNSGSQYSGSEVTSGLGSSATSADLSGGGGSRALSNTRSASADRANSPSNSDPSSLGGGGLSTASSGLGANPGSNNRRSSASHGGFQASNNSANLLAGAGFYKAHGSRMGGANGAGNLSPAALKNLKARAKKDRLRHCQGNIQCLLVVSGMSDQKFKNLVIKSGNRGIASYFSRRGQPSLPREIGSGMHDAISAAASIINKNITLDEEGDLEYITPENTNY